MFILCSECGEGKGRSDPRTLPSALDGGWGLVGIFFIFDCSLFSLSAVFKHRTFCAVPFLSSFLSSPLLSPSSYPLSCSLALILSSLSHLQLILYQQPTIMLNFDFDIELDTEQPFIVELDMRKNHIQTLSGAITLKSDRAEVFKVAEIAIHGHSKCCCCCYAHFTLCSSPPLLICLTTFFFFFCCFAR